MTPLPAKSTFNKDSEKHSPAVKTPEAILIAYDSRGRPVYKNNFIAGLMNDELPVAGLKAVAFVGGIGDNAPKEVRAALIAHLNNSFGGDRTSLGLVRAQASAEYLEKRRRFSELRELLKERAITPTTDGWIAVRVVDSDKIRAAKITLGESAISTEIDCFEIEGWNEYELETLRLSDEYRSILLWMYENKFL